MCIVRMIVATFLLMTTFIHLSRVLQHNNNSFIFNIWKLLVVIQLFRCKILHIYITLKSSCTVKYIRRWHIEDVLLSLPLSLCVCYVFGFYFFLLMVLYSIFYPYFGYFIRISLFLSLFFRAKSQFFDLLSK